jgi:pilus assembly protein FimV
MKNVNRLPVACAVGVLIMGIAVPAWSLGFGRPVSRAILGESFQATVPLRLEPGEEFDDKCLVADVYFGDDKVEASRVQAQLLPGKGPDRSVRISTAAVINEPVVTLYLAAGCSAKVSRKFVAFADPPQLAPLADAPLSAPRGSDAGGASDAEPSPSAVAGGGSAGAAPLQTGQGGAQSRDGARPTARPRAQPPRSESDLSTAAAAAPRASRPSGAENVESFAGAARPAQAQAAASRRDRLSARLDAGVPAQRAASRLVLDPVEADASVAPSLVMSSELKADLDVDSPQAQERRAAAAALWAAMNASPEQLARDRSRMQELEQRLARLQQDSVAAREKVLALEARVREAEEGKLTQPLVMGLAGVSALLAAALFYVVRRQKPAEAQATWWQPEDESAALAEESVRAPLAEPALDRTAAEFVAVEPPAMAPDLAALTTQGSVAPVSTQAPSAAEPLIMPAAPAAAVAGSGATMPLAAPSVSISAVNPDASEAVRALSVEELIDLEQQAEFFSVLGQDDAAIELLESSIRNTAGSSPLPFLKLLEMYQRLGRRDDYQRAQAEFNQRFNAYAPAWDADLSHGHALSDYPGVLERLQAIWSSPSQAMSVLQKSLTRPDETVETFDLPAYRELLFLYAVARDLSERESQDRPAVDLLAREAQALTMVPDIDLDEPTTVAPLMATRPVKATPDARPSFSLDLSLDDPATDHIDVLADTPDVSAQLSHDAMTLAPVDPSDSPSSSPSNSPSRR